ncbi:hypothetical protein PHLCEN_2v8499 [Hermanssonia centrifuga]|uniref:Uncharacterized protein n=1 Tax=Hermanssonia centrifuga TaxID=98765 RepID=A0A2R6NTG4_9APHY|nr:hypothetical protein PHLCEN_2v8499 [Hermanssonia centrifuga]
MVFTCVDCNTSYATSKGLKQHRNACKTRKQHLLASAHRARTKAEQERTAKLQRRANQDIASERQAVREVLTEEPNFHHSESTPLPDILMGDVAGPSNAIAKEVPHYLPPTRSGRKRKAPKLHKDFLPSVTSGQLYAHVSRLVPPQPPSIVLQPLQNKDTLSPPAPTAVITEDAATHFDTEANNFGVFRRYAVKPMRDLEDEELADTLCDAPTIAVSASKDGNTLAHSFGRAVVNSIKRNLDGARTWFTPFLSASVFRLLHWTYTGSSSKSASETERLVREVLLAPDFKCEDLSGFNVSREEHRLDKFDTARRSFAEDDGWNEATVKIPLPKEKVKHKSEADAPQLEVKGVWYRKLLDVVVAAYKESTAQQMQFIPYKLFFRESADAGTNWDEDAERVYSEVYTCDAMLEEDARIRAQPRNCDDNDDIEYAVAPLMLWSDSTHLANFGTASLWPIYLYFGALSKYIRCRTSSFAAHHLAYLPSCIIPCIDGLLPEPLNKIVLDMLWDLAVWHALAKLRLHTETTLRIFEKATTNVGTTVRRFAFTCKDIDTRELPSEEAARGRREAAQGKGRSAPGNKQRLLNLSTFKWHDLGHYVAIIRQLGTTENYSTQVGECEHKRVKKFYGRTNKHQHEGQIAAKQRREELLEKIKDQDEEAKKARLIAQKKLSEILQESEINSDLQMSHSDQIEPKKRGRPRKEYFGLTEKQQDPLPQTSYSAHHHISESRRYHTDVTAWLAKNRDDPSLVDFLPSLKDHLLARLTGRVFDGDEHEFTDIERGSLRLKDNRLYLHKVMRINYTTYDMRRDQDSINPRTHADIMVLSPEEDQTHPYWFGRVLGIYHAFVMYTGLGSESTSLEYKRTDFLWVRWFGPCPGESVGFRKRRLPQIGFIPYEKRDAGPFGFLDPALVVRAVHLIPAFHHGKTDTLLPDSIVRQPSEGNEDWAYYYVNIFVDRDMFMRFLGGGIGHKATRLIVKISETLKMFFVYEDQASREAAGSHSVEDFEPEAQVDEDEEDEAAEDDEQAELPEEEEDEEDEAEAEAEEDIQLEEDDYGYAFDEVELEEEEEEEEKDLGPEDGEDGMLIEDDVGYDAF